MSTVIPKAHWYIKNYGGRQHVFVDCPECGATLPLDDHDVGGDGVVAPSVECPMRSCSFHAMVRLEDYTN